MAIINDGRLEYEVGSINVNYPNSDKEVYFGSTPLIVPNNWAPPAKKALEKGSIITMDGKDYRVLKLNDTVAEVLAMYEPTDPIVFDSAESGYTETYANKNIDTYCDDTFYSGLSTMMKSAIVDKTFAQDSWSWSTTVPTESHYIGKTTSASYYLTLENAAYDTSITRHCYCLSIQDVLDYLEATTSMDATNTTLVNTNIWQMFWNASTPQKDKNIWLRSARSAFSHEVFYFIGGNGLLYSVDVDEANILRPAFQIDLSKVEYTIK